MEIILFLHFPHIPRPHNQSYPTIILQPLFCFGSFPSTASYSITPRTPSDIED